jgi:hypothetical protein
MAGRGGFLIRDELLWGACEEEHHICPSVCSNKTPPLWMKRFS